MPQPAEGTPNIPWSQRRPTALPAVPDLALLAAAAFLIVTASWLTAGSRLPVPRYSAPWYLLTGLADLPGYTLGFLIATRRSVRPGAAARPWLSALLTAMLIIGIGRLAHWWTMRG